MNWRKGNEREAKIKKYGGEFINEKLRMNEWATRGCGWEIGRT